ncbi:MAG: hypothetical protein ACI82F_004639 [Planctomycetota bacterium]|jgi:hypothetical protein
MKSALGLFVVTALLVGSFTSCQAASGGLASDVSLTTDAARNAHPGVQVLLDAALAHAVIPQAEVHPNGAIQRPGLLRSRNAGSRSCELHSSLPSRGPAGARFCVLVLFFSGEHLRELELGMLKLPSTPHLLTNPPNLSTARSAGLVVLTTDRGGLLFPEHLEGFSLVLGAD